MPKLYPLQFEPLFRRYLWGGRRLASVLGKSIGEGSDYAESWEIVDRGADQSVVASGELAGRTLHEIVMEHGAELFGRHAPQKSFPLLFKFLDAERTLSVQVHPNDEQAAKLDPPDLGKTEAWVVLATEPGSLIYAGLKPGIGRAELAAAIDAGKCDECLHSFEPRVGDCVFIPAGTIHALGAGLVIAEIQQASDTTYRLFDWNRVDASGKSRPLHIAQSLDVIDYQRGPVNVQMPVPLAGLAERLVACDKFVLDRWQFDRPVELATGNAFRLLAVIGGEATLEYAATTQRLPLGSTVLVPAVCETVRLAPHGKATLLVIGLP
ncbi:MAG: type I phosphomannose isomerase catalytic subunit [Pirellulales bacterium]